MHKLFTKIVSVCLGLTMAVGVGAAVASNSEAVPVHAAGGTFTKITSTSDLTSGAKYLIVSESDKIAFNGSLTTIDAVSNTQSVTISSNSITTTSDFYFTITSKTGGYSIKGSGGYYIGSTSSNANELKNGTSDSYTNTITWDSTNSCFIIRGTNSYLVYNSSSGQTRFRFFKPSTCNNGAGTGAYHKISLFKVKSVSNYTVTYNAGLGTGSHAADTVTAGQSVTLPDSGFSRDGYTFDGWATASSGSKAYDLGASYTPSGNVTLYAHYAANPYAVVRTYKNCSGTAPVVTYHGNTINDTLTPDTGYHLPSSVSVKVGETTSSYSILNNKLTIPNVTGNVTYTVEAILNSYNVSGSITNGSLSNTGSISHGEAFSGTITPTSDYHLPDSITVTIGGASSSDFTYDASTGVVDISSTYVTGDIVVTGTCYMEYAIGASAVNGYVDSSSSTTIKDDDTAYILFVADENYILPGVDGISVTNATIVDYADGLVEIGSPTGPVTVVCTCIQGGYRDITVQMQHVTASGTGTEVIEAGGGATVVITADSGYRLPAKSAFTVTGADAAYSFNGNKVTITLSNCVDNVVISATAIQIFEVTSSITNGSASPASGTVDSGSTFNTTLSANAHYKLPSSISVTMGGAATQSFTYNPSTGAVSVTNISGAVVITASMAALANYNVTCNLTNVSKTSGPATIEENGSATYVFTASGYGLPDSVSVLNASYTWTKASGTLVISNPTNDVSITIVGEAKTLLSISFSPTSGSYTLGDDFVKPTVTATYNTGVETVTDTENISYSGYDPYSATVQTVTISYGGKTATSTYTATVSAKTVEHSYDKISAVSDITEGDYIMAYSTYAFDGRDANNGYTTVSISNNKIAGTTENDKLALHITPVTGGYTLQVSTKSYNNAGKYLGFTSGNNTLSFNTNAVTVASQTVSSSTHYTYASGGAFTFGDSSTVLSWNENSGNYRFRFYKVSTTSSSTNGKNYYAFNLYKRVESVSGSLIRITASYNGGEKYVGDSISTSDFTVQKQLDTSVELSPVASGYTISANTLTSESNSITVSYTEDNITKTAVVVVPATPRSATVTSVTLVQGVGVVKDYIDYSAAAWDYTGLTVHCVWSDSTFNEDLSVADLIQSGDATVSPAKPAVGVTSFTISYKYHEVSMTSNSVTGISVVADYVTKISWTGTHAEHFKAFSGGQLTTAQVGAWSVVPTFAGAGQGSALSFGQYTLKVGSKTISSLPYTWASEDDGKELTITYGKDVNGDDFVKKNNTAVGNICASINAIDHEEIITPAYDETINAYVKITSSSELTSGGTYLIVGETSGVALNGSLGTSIDAANDYVSVTIEDNKISRTSTIDAAAFTITSKTGGYSVQTVGKVFIGHSGSKNTLNSSTTDSFTNAIEFDGNGGVTLTCNGRDLQYNSGDSRFRYYTSTQQDISLFKLVNKTIHHDAVTETTYYANDIDHFDAQKNVVTFAKFMNTTMNGTNVCSGTFANLESAWEDVADKYDELFGSGTSLNETELAWAKNMLKYATAAWGIDAEAACVEKAMKTYEHCVSTYDLYAFMSPVRSVSVKVSPLVNIFGENTNTVAIIVIISMISVTAIGGYFFLRRRKEN